MQAPKSIMKMGQAQESRRTPNAVLLAHRRSWTMNGWQLEVTSMAKPCKGEGRKTSQALTDHEADGHLEG